MFPVALTHDGSSPLGLAQFSDLGFQRFQSSQQPFVTHGVFTVLPLVLGPNLSIPFPLAVMTHIRFPFPFPIPALLALVIPMGFGKGHEAKTSQ